jgi:hypothetical protein
MKNSRILPINDTRQPADETSTPRCTECGETADYLQETDGFKTDYFCTCCIEAKHEKFNTYMEYIEEKTITFDDYLKLEKLFEI